MVSRPEYPSLSLDLFLSMGETMDPDLMKLLKRPVFSPDYLELERTAYHLVFDPGPFLEEIPVLCSAYTVERMSLYIWDRLNKAIPIRLQGQPSARIGGALYLMKPETLIKLDWRKQNGVLFERERTSVYVPAGETGLSIIPDVWIHVGIKSVWKDKILWLDKLEYRLAEKYIDNTRELNRHYRFSPKKVEDFNPALPPTQWTEEVRVYVARKNREETSKLRRFMRPITSLFHQKPKVKPLPLP